MPKYLELDVSIRGTPIWRSIRVRPTQTLHTLHRRLQAAFGWTDSHLYMFHKDDAPFAASPFYEAEDDFMAARPANRTRIKPLLARPGDRCEYEYDFGDSWVHDITVERVVKLGDDTPWLIDGELAGPPEDCGGVHGYERCVAVVRTGVDPVGEPAQELLRWLDGWHPDAFESPADDEDDFELDADKLEEAAFAILCLTLHDGRAWKGLDWELMDRLHARGWIGDPRSKAKSVAVTPPGEEIAKELLREHFGRRG